jgi:hypothetical protein
MTLTPEHLPLWVVFQSAASNAKAAKSYAGFLNNVLKEDWGHDWELEQQEVSVKKKVMEIWERQGFDSQKEYDDFMYKKQIEAYSKKV